MQKASHSCCEQCFQTIHFAGDTTTEFVWLENPGDGTMTNWPQHMISSEGPDVHFRRYTLSSGGVDYSVFIVGEFFAEKLAIYYVEDNNWADPSIETKVRYRKLFPEKRNKEQMQNFDKLSD